MPAFHIEQVCCTINGESHYNFDTIVLSVNIVDKNNQLFTHAMAEVNKFVKLLSEKCEELDI